MDKRVLVALFVLVVAGSIALASGSSLTGNVVANGSEKDELSVDLKINGKDSPNKIGFNGTFNVSWKSSKKIEYCNGYGNYVPLEEEGFWNLKTNLEPSGEEELVSVFALGGEMDKVSYMKNLQIGIQCWNSDNEFTKGSITVPLKRNKGNIEKSETVKLSLHETHKLYGDFPLKLNGIESNLAFFSINYQNDSEDFNLSEEESKEILGGQAGRNTEIKLLKIIATNTNQTNSSKELKAKIHYGETSEVVEKNDTEPKENDEIEEEPDSEESKTECKRKSSEPRMCYINKGDTLEISKYDYKFEIDSLGEGKTELIINGEETGELSIDEKYVLEKGLIKIKEISEAKVKFEFIEQEAKIQKKGYCDNCNVEGTCVALGFRTDKEYCSSDSGMVKQKPEGSKCANNFQCKSNICIEEECVSQKFFDRFVGWMKNIFS